MKKQPAIEKASETQLSLETLLLEAAKYAELSISKNTRRAYTIDWREFSEWCSKRRLQPLPATPQTLVSYFTDLARTHRVSSISRKYAALAYVHRAAKKEAPVLDPMVKQVIRGIRRTKGVAPVQKDPALTIHICEVMASLNTSTLDIRDRALLLFGFAGGFRRSELVGLNFDDVSLGEEGVIVHVRKSKTDQEGRGRKIGIEFGKNQPTCPIKALGEWLKVSEIVEGPLFREVNRWGHIGVGRLTADSVARIIKRRFGDLGLDEKKFAGHSLRAGLITSAILADVNPIDIQRHVGHASLDMLRRYIRDANLFKRNPTGKIGL